MPFFSGFAGEFGKQLAQSRSEEADRAEKQDALTAGILQHLTTSPDPEIQSHAISGLLDLAGPKKYAKGLSGWLGKQATNPALPTIQQLIAHGRQVETPAHVPQANVTSGMPEQLPGDTLDAQGQPQAKALPFAPAATPPPAFKPGDVYQPPRTVTVPRQVFDSPEEAAGKTAEAETSGHLRGQLNVMRGQGVTGGPLSPAEQEILFPHGTLTSAGVVQGKQVPTGSLDDSGRPLDPEGYYQTRMDPRNPGRTTYVPTIAPASVTNQAAIGSRYQITHYVGPDGKTPGAWRVSRDGSKPPEFIGYLPQKGQYLQYVDPETQETRYIAAPAVYTPGATLQPSSQPQATTAPGPAAAVPGAPPAMAPVAPAAAGAPPAAGPARVPPPAAGAVPRAAGGPPAAGAHPGGIAGGRKISAQPQQGAVIGPNGDPQVATALYDAGTKTYYDPQNPKQALQGFIPGPEGAAVVTNYQQANTTLITIHAAMKAIEDAGLLNSNDPAVTAAKMAAFYQGTVGNDPVAAAVDSLTNLAGIQGASQYVRSNSRSYQMFQAASMHLPRAPSERAAALSQTPVVGGLINPATAAVAGSHGWDSFSSMYQKLKQAESMIQQGKASLNVLTGKTSEHAVDAGGAPTPAAAPPPGPAAPAGRGAAPGAGRGRGAAPVAPGGAQAVPKAVRDALQGLGQGRHTLSDGSVWDVDTAGNISKAG
jgi:hypothetical protein